MLVPASTFLSNIIITRFFHELCLKLMETCLPIIQKDDKGEWVHCRLDSLSLSHTQTHSYYHLYYLDGLTLINLITPH